MRGLLPVLTLLAALTAFGCLQQNTTPKTQDIVASIPFGEREQAQYRVVDRNNPDKPLGNQTLNITRQGDRFQLRQHFDGKDLNGQEGTDDSTVIVDAATLKPISATRERVVGKNTQKLEVAYDAAKQIVTITEIQDSKRVPSPRRLGDHYYDNDSSLFLWRTVTLQDGYKAAYRTVVTGSGEQFVVQVNVVGKEQVTVPAGTFQAWRLEIRSGNVKQVVWYADTPPRPLVQYDNSIQLFQLGTLE